MLRTKIKQITPLSWVIVGTGAILLAASLSMLVDYLTGISTISPGTNTADVAIQSMVEVFASPEHPADTRWGAHGVAALIGILIYLIIGPGLIILFGNEDSKRAFNLFVAGLILSLAGVLNIGAEAGIETLIFQNSRESAARNEMEDRVHYNLSKLAIESYEYLVLPEEMGGGGGSFENLTNSDLPSYDELRVGSFEIEKTPSDTLLQIKGRGVTSKIVENVEPDTVTMSVLVSPEAMFQWVRE